MRALIYDGSLHLEQNLPAPVPGADEALLKIRLAGICNTDLELTAGMYQFSGVLGHEFIAEVVQGPQALVGQRVVGEINVACGICDFCQRGIPSQCRHRSAVGIHGHPGAFADYLTLPGVNLHVVPDSVSDEAAVFVEPLAAALQVSEMVHIPPGNRVLVLGIGKLGMLVAQVLRLQGADVIGVIRRQKQADLLARWGIASCDAADLEPERAQVVVDCTGKAEGFADALRLVESRGTIVLKSTYHGMPQIDMTQIAVREIKVVGSRCGPFKAALRLLERNLVDVESLIDARYSLDCAVEAVEHARSTGTLKVILQV